MSSPHDVSTLSSDDEWSKEKYGAVMLELRHLRHAKTPTTDDQVLEAAGILMHMKLGERPTGESREGSTEIQSITLQEKVGARSSVSPESSDGFPGSQRAKCFARQDSLDRSQSTGFGIMDLSAVENEDAKNIASRHSTAGSASTDASMIDPSSTEKKRTRVSRSRSSRHKPRSSEASMMDTVSSRKDRVLKKEPTEEKLPAPTLVRMETQAFWERDPPTGALKVTHVIPTTEDVSPTATREPRVPKARRPRAISGPSQNLVLIPADRLPYILTRSPPLVPYKLITPTATGALTGSNEAALAPNPPGQAQVLPTTDLTVQPVPSASLLEPKEAPAEEEAAEEAAPKEESVGEASPKKPTS